jgi:membrane protein implicated in regulation of membrane protease activity
MELAIILAALTVLVNWTISLVLASLPVALGVYLGGRLLNRWLIRTSGQDDNDAYSG